MGMIREVDGQKLDSKIQCLDACQTQVYQIHVANANYATATTFKFTKDFCYIVRKLLRYPEKKPLEKVQPRLFELLKMLRVS